MGFPSLLLFPLGSYYPGTETTLPPGVPPEGEALPSGIVVEVRDKTLARIGQIRPEDLDFNAKDMFNNVGEWTIRLPVEHLMATELRKPGAGIVVSGPDGTTLFSGPVIGPVFANSLSDPEGTVTFDGVTDDIILQDYLAIPQPSNPNLATQSAAHDTRTGDCESLMHAYVSANIGPNAPSGRRNYALTMGTNLKRGKRITKSARFATLGNLMADIALGSKLGFRVVQRGDRLVFETFETRDLTDVIRLDVLNGQLAGQKVTVSAPSVTRVLVAGQEQGVNRQFVYRQSATSIAAEAEWGRRIERFVDQRQTSDWAELTQAADKILLEEGFAATSAQATPSDDTTMRFGIDWNIGDIVAVVAESVELQSLVTGMALSITSDGAKLGILIGDASQLNRETSTTKRIVSLEDRLSNLERSAEFGIQNLMGTETPLMDGEAVAGNSARLARENHRHPSDDTKVDKAMLTVSVDAPPAEGEFETGHVWIQY